MTSLALSNRSLGRLSSIATTLDAILALATTEFNQCAADQATANFERAIQVEPRDVRSYSMLARVEEAKGNWQEAQRQYQQALAVQPGYPAAADNLAYMLIEHGGNPDVALSLAQTARRSISNPPDTADTLALVYLHTGAYSSAIDLLQQASKDLPQNQTYVYHLGLAYQKMKDRARAKVHLQKELELNPKSSQADQIRKALAEVSS
jgi:Flp pilus assembly protein TadD